MELENLCCFGVFLENSDCLEELIKVKEEFNKVLLVLFEFMGLMGKNFIDVCFSFN